MTKMLHAIFTKVEREVISLTDWSKISVTPYTRRGISWLQSHFIDINR